MTMNQEWVARALIVDDEQASRVVSRRLLTKNPQITNPFEIFEAASISEALRILSQTDIDIILLDRNVGPDPNDPSQDGVHSIPEMRSLRPSAQIVVITGSSDESGAVLARKNGAFDYVLKSSKELPKRIADAVQYAHARFREIASERLKTPFITESELSLGGQSALWKKAVHTARRFAPNDFPVLINGATGCGKTELARLIHCERKRIDPSAARGLVEMNIASLSAELAERELFGNEPGAYTGATHRKQGFFELANNGTLFLDEIGDADLDLQKKILKVVEDGVFFRIGGPEKPIHSKFKLICATHRDLKKMVREGTFREDLYMRLSILRFKIPTLSERKEDIPDIVRALLPKISKRSNAQVTLDELPKDFVEYLVENDFDGNVRGIYQQVARLLVLAPQDSSGRPVMKNWKRFLDQESAESPQSMIRSSITLRDLRETPYDVIGESFPGVGELLSEVEGRIYREALEKYGYNNAIARALKISRSTASTKLKRFGMTN